MKISFKNQDKNDFLTYIYYTILYDTIAYYIRNLSILSKFPNVPAKFVHGILLTFKISVGYNYFPFSFSTLLICGDLFC